MATASAKRKQPSYADDSIDIQDKFNKNAATLTITVLILIVTYIAVTGLAGRIEIFNTLENILNFTIPVINFKITPIRGMIPVILLPTIVGIVVLLYMIYYSDHKNINKSRFDTHTRWSLTNNRFGNWLIKRRWFQILLTGPNMIFFILVMIFGFYGYGGYIQQSDAGFVNGATFLTWNIWWVGMVFTFPLLGRVWCTMCPLGAIGEWVHRTRMPRHISFFSYFLRYTMAGAFAIIGFMITGVTFGLMILGKPIEFLTGEVKTPLTGNFIDIIFGFISYQAQAPFNLINAMITVTFEDNFPLSLIASFSWIVLILFSVLVAGTFGFVVKDFLIAAIWGTPLRQGEDPKRPYPKKLATLWITVILFAGTMIFDFAVGMFVNPLLTAAFIFLLIATSVVLGFIYERRAFCMYVCPLAGIIGMYGATGTIELRNKDMKVCSQCKTKDCLKGRAESYGYSALSPNKKVNFEWPAGYSCPMGEFTMVMEDNIGCIMCSECLKSCRNDNIEIALRPPSLDLFLKRKKRFDEASLAAVLIGITLALILPGAPEVAAIFAAFKDDILRGAIGVPDFIAGIPVAEYTTLILWFIVGAFLIPIGLLFFASWISLKIGGIHNMNSKQFFTLFAYAILPLGLSSHMAYWVVRLFEHTPAILGILGDPFANQFLGIPIYDNNGNVLLNNPITLPVALVYVVNPLFILFRDLSLPTLFTEDFTYFFRLLILFVGFTYSIFASYKVAIKNFGQRDKGRAIRIVMPILVYMTVFTALALFSGRSWSPY